MRNICNTLHLGLYIICGANLIVFSVIATMSVAAMVDEEDILLTSDLKRSVKVPLRVVIGSVAIICTLKVLFSILAITGIKKGKPLFVALYVAYGAFMTIAIFVTALLLLINNLWTYSLPIVVANILYVTCLVMMHDGYESMIRGDASENLEHQLLEEEGSPDE